MVLIRTFTIVLWIFFDKGEALFRRQHILVWCRAAQFWGRKANWYFFLCVLRLDLHILEAIFSPHDVHWLETDKRLKLNLLEEDISEHVCRGLNYWVNKTPRTQVILLISADNWLKSGVGNFARSWADLFHSQMSGVDPLPGCSINGGSLGSSLGKILKENHIFSVFWV